MLRQTLQVRPRGNTRLVHICGCLSKGEWQVAEFCGNPIDIDGIARMSAPSSEELDGLVSGQHVN